MLTWRDADVARCWRGRYDDIFALLHDDVQLRTTTPTKRAHSGTAVSQPRAQMKQIFITSFNAFKKALTYDAICAKVRPRAHLA